MADLGTIAKDVGRRTRRVRVASRAVVYRNLTYIDNGGSFYGTVRRAGLVIPNVVCALYGRDSKALIARAMTASDGTYAFHGLDLTLTEGYYVLAFDPATGMPFNYTLVRAHLTPGAP